MGKGSCFHGFKTMDAVVHNLPQGSVLPQRYLGGLNRRDSVRRSLHHHLDHLMFNQAIPSAENNNERMDLILHRFEINGENVLAALKHLHLPPSFWAVQAARQENEGQRLQTRRIIQYGINFGVVLLPNAADETRHEWVRAAATAELAGGIRSARAIVKELLGVGEVTVVLAEIFWVPMARWCVHDVGAVETANKIIDILFEKFPTSMLVLNMIQSNFHRSS